MKYKYKLLIYLIISISISIILMIGIDILKQEKEIAEQDYSWYTPVNGEPSKNKEDNSVKIDSLSIEVKESKKVKVSYDQKNFLKSVNGIKVSDSGSFHITIDGINYKIGDISLKCPECGHRSSSGVLQNGLGLCTSCGHQFRYEDFDPDFSCGIIFYCPDCKEESLYINSKTKFCPSCGRDTTEDKKRLRNFNWKSQ